MRRVILHLGMPRAGSTTLQHVWLRHRAALLPLGILYPELLPQGAAPRHINHQHLGEALDAGAAAPLEALLAQLDAALRSDAETVILSNEMWAHRHPRALAPMLDRLRRSGRAVTPLAVVKSTPEAANSAYTLRVLFLSEGRDFASYSGSFSIRFRLDLQARLLPWQRHCGALIALPLRDVQDAAPLVARVWRASGLHERAGHLLDDGDLERRENASAGPVTIEACRRLAATGLRAGQGDDAMRRISRAVEDAATARGADAEPFRGYDSGDAAALERRWAGSNTRFARATWGAAWSSRVALSAPLPANELLRTRDAEGLRQVTDVLEEVCARFRLPMPGPAPRGALIWGRLPSLFR